MKKFHTRDLPEHLRMLGDMVVFRDGGLALNLGNEQCEICQAWHSAHMYMPMSALSEAEAIHLSNEIQKACKATKFSRLLNTWDTINRLNLEDRVEVKHLGCLCDEKVVVAYVDHPDSNWSGQYLLLGVFSDLEKLRKAYPGMKFTARAGLNAKEPTTSEIDYQRVEIDKPVNEYIGSYDG